MDEKDLDILYRPKIEIERDYYSDGVIPHEQKVENITEEQREEQIVESRVPTEIEKAIETQYETAAKLLRIRKITEILPPKAKKVTDDLIDSLLIIIGTEIPKLEEIKLIEDGKPDEEKYDIPTEEVTSQESEPTSVKYEVSTSDETYTEDWPTMTSSGFVFQVIKNKDSWDLANEQYLLDSTKIKEAFVEEYNDILQSYAYQLVSAMSEIGIDNVEALNYTYEGETVSGITDNYQHLNDIIARNQNAVNEFQDIFRKTHDSYTTDAIFTAYDVVSQERVRYLKEKYKDEAVTGYIELYDKKLLGQVRDEYEKRYVAARSDVYKLLHSAATVSKKILDAQLDLVLSKCSLLAKNVDIFAQKEYESEVFANGTMATDKSAESTSTANDKKATETKSTDNNSNNKEANKADDKNTVSGAQDKTKEAASGSIKKSNDIVGNALSGITTTVKAVAQDKIKEITNKGKAT